jgi:hypothetical protein
VPGRGEPEGLEGTTEEPVKPEPFVHLTKSSGAAYSAEA